MADRSPAVGAVVVSTLGGNAITDADGRFSLVLPEPMPREEFRVTAIATIGGASHLRAVPAHDADEIVLMEMQGSEQCEPHWLPGFDLPGVDSPVNALAVFDDGLGGGPALFAGGQFLKAGGVAANRVAKWNGVSWSTLGSGVNGSVEELIVYDDGRGAGPKLYAGGSFTVAGGVAASRIAKWDGQSWSGVGGGANNTVRVFAIHDDGLGDGPALYAGGLFTTAGGVSANRIAKWNGSAWSALGGGMNTNVRALAVFDDGTGGGPSLYAGGDFTLADGAAASFMAKWNGASWSAVGGGTNGAVRALAVFDDGAGEGPILFAGGDFTSAGGGAANRIARWSGAAWSALGSGMNGGVHALAVFDDGAGDGARLYAGGDFTIAGGSAAGAIAKWSGGSWSALGGGLSPPGVRALGIFDDGAGDGPSLYAGGLSVAAGALKANRIAKWNGIDWHALGNGLDESVQAIAVFDDGLGDGPALYAGGHFITAGGITVNRIARWNGEEWSALGTGLNGSVIDFAVHDDGLGGGAALFVAGGFTIANGVAANWIAKWDGVSFSPLGSGMSDAVFSLGVFDDGLGGGPALYAGGWFTSAGGVEAIRIAKWDGVSWSALGSGMNDNVTALEVFDDGLGGGPALYAGGTFTIAGGVAAIRVAKWDGRAWSPLGIGMVPDGVSSFAVFDDGLGGGPALYAGGYFTSAGGTPANRVARWDGRSWSALGSGLNHTVTDLAVFDDGHGAALYACGTFSSAGGAPANRLAKWNGEAWSAVGAGVGIGTKVLVNTLVGFDDGSGGGSVLHVGGWFTSAGGVAASSIATLQGCPSEPPCAPADFNCDGIVNGDDLGTLLGDWGACPGCATNLDGDGDVDSDDLEMLLEAWGVPLLGVSPPTAM